MEKVRILVDEEPKKEHSAKKKCTLNPPPPHQRLATVQGHEDAVGPLLPRDPKDTAMNAKVYVKEKLR